MYSVATASNGERGGGRGREQDCTLCCQVSGSEREKASDAEGSAPNGERRSEQDCTVKRLMRAGLYCKATDESRTVL